MKCVLTIPLIEIHPRESSSTIIAYVVRSKPHPAELLRDRHPEQAQLAHLRHDRLRELVHRVVMLGLRQDLLIHELPHHLEDRPLLLGRLVEGHRAILSWPP